MSALALTPAQAAVLRRRIAAIGRERGGYTRYLNDPCGYAADVLGVDWWPAQQEVAESVTSNTMTMVRASHSVGKTHVSGGIVNWWYDVADPSICLTTAPTARQVVDLLWKEVRIQRGRRGGLQPKAPRMESSPNHYAAGFTARDVNAFQGTHEERLLIIFDEAVGVDEAFWTGAEAMLTSGEHNRFLAIYNPTDTASAAYSYELASDANVIVISAMEHPNVAAQLRGEPRPFPKAIDLAWLHDKIAGDNAWCTRIEASSATVTDVEWPPQSGEWYRPGPLFESRVLGRWPSQPVGAVWSETAFRIAESASLPEPEDVPYEIGCDVARQGNDNTVIHIRRGPVSVHHESHNGWLTDQTGQRLKSLALEYGQKCGVDGRKIAVKVDDDGVGGGVVDHADGFRFVGVGAGTVANEPEQYPNRRSELWFAVAERAMQGRLDLSRLPLSTRNELRRQCMAPTWRVDSQGRRVVEPKDQTKKRLSRSPDDADAMNLAYSMPSEIAAARSDTPNIRQAFAPDRQRLSRLGLR